LVAAEAEAAESLEEILDLGAVPVVLEVKDFLVVALMLVQHMLIQSVVVVMVLDLEVQVILEMLQV
jgi:hypothetical protein